jgi:hypothetical protein
VSPHSHKFSPVSCCVIAALVKPFQLVSSPPHELIPVFPVIKTVLLTLHSSFHNTLLCSCVHINSAPCPLVSLQHLFPSFFNYYPRLDDSAPCPDYQNISSNIAIKRSYHSFVFRIHLKSGSCLPVTMPCLYKYHPRLTYSAPCPLPSKRYFLQFSLASPPLPHALNIVLLTVFPTFHAAHLCPRLHIFKASCPLVSLHK